MLFVDNTDVLQRAALVLNFIFTLLAFKIITSYNIFRKLFKFLSVLNRYISVSANGITIGRFEQQPKGTIKSLFLPVIIIFLLIILHPGLLYKFMCLPKYFFKWGTNIWSALTEWYFWILNTLVSFICYLFGSIFYGLIWSYVIFAPVKFVLLIFEHLSKISRKWYEFIVFALFTISWAITYLLTF